MSMTLPPLDWLWTNSLHATHLSHFISLIYAEECRSAISIHLAISSLYHSPLLPSLLCLLLITTTSQFPNVQTCYHFFLYPSPPLLLPSRSLPFSLLLCPNHVHCFTIPIVCRSATSCSKDAKIPLRLDWCISALSLSWNYPERGSSGCHLINRINLPFR